MSKVILEIPYGSFVIDGKDAMAVIEAMSKAEQYKTKWHDGNKTSHHIFPVDGNSTFGFRLLTNESYNMYKLAGKPED